MTNILPPATIERLKEEALGKIDDYQPTYDPAPTVKVNAAILLHLLAERERYREACELPVEVENNLVAWIDGPDGNGLADDAIVKLTDAAGRPIVHLTVGWFRAFFEVTRGIDTSPGSAHIVPVPPPGAGL